MKVCPRCLGEGRKQWPEYGHMGLKQLGEPPEKWIGPTRHYDYIGEAKQTEERCNPCQRTGYLKCR